MYFQPNRLCVAFLVFCNTFTFAQYYAICYSNWMLHEWSICIVFIQIYTVMYGSYVLAQANRMQYVCIMYLDFLLLHICIYNSVENACLPVQVHIETPVSAGRMYAVQNIGLSS